MKINRYSFKAAVLLAAFAITAVWTFFSMYIQEEEGIYTTMESATLPIVYMKTEGGVLINPARGYTSHIESGFIFNGITPLYPDRSLNIAVYTYGENVTELSYEIREPDTGRLIENTVVSDYTVQGDSINAVLNIKNLIDKGKEYNLIVNITTDKHEEIQYFERILWADNMETDSLLEFALSFNEYTYDSEKISLISEWIETSSEGDNTNFGKVDIHSTREQIGFGSLVARVESRIVPVIYELNNSVMQVCLEYIMAAPGDNNIYDRYNVSEYYRIRKSGDNMYLLNYDRETNQIFDSKNDLQASGRINLGIKSDLENVEMMADTTGKYTAFVQQGALWCYYSGGNTFTNVFSFQDFTTDDYRESYEQHEIKILEVSDTGNIRFLVYGYMNRGKHEGTTGISLCSYDYEDNQVNELLYIPLDVPYSAMKGSVGEVAYISEDNIFYLKISNYLYAFDLISNENMLITSGLTEGTYVVNEDGSRIAYHYNHKEYDNVIRIFDMKSATEHYINSESGELMQAAGYIGNDLIYGVAKTEDIWREDNGNVLFPMYNLIIVDGEYNVIKEYSNEGIYVSEAEIEGMRVNLTRVVRNEEGYYENTTIDQLMNRQENEDSKTIGLEVVTTSTRQKELFLDLATEVSNASKATLRYSKKVVFEQGNEIILQEDFKYKEYYAYALGRYLGAYDSVAAAVKAIKDNQGMVLDSQGFYVWKKTAGNSSPMWNDAYSQLSAGNAKYNLTGCTLDNVLYYVSIGNVVMAKTGVGEYILIYQYDTNNIYYYDYATSGLETMTREEANKIFIQWGNTFLVQ